MNSNTSSSVFQSNALLATVLWLGITTSVFGQGSPEAQDPVRQVPAPLPKLALNGAVGETVGRNQYHRIVLMITNWEKFPSEMFIIPVGRKLPPNPCASARSRVILAVYSEQGSPMANCIEMPKAGSLGKFSILIQKGNPVPEYVYAVLNDRQTGAAYRSNLVSPSSGATK